MNDGPNRVKKRISDVYVWEIRFGQCESAVYSNDRVDHMTAWQQQPNIVYSNVLLPCRDKLGDEDDVFEVINIIAIHKKEI